MTPAPRRAYLSLPLPCGMWRAELREACPQYVREEASDSGEPANPNRAAEGGASAVCEGGFPLTKVGYRR